MKKRLQGLVAGMLIASMLTSGVVFAKQISQTAQLFYNNIKIYIDGGEIVPKDANGNVVEPFTINGTTYLPVRAISNAFGKDVEWDGATQSVYIGKKDQTKPDNYLDRIQYNDYRKADETNGNNKFAIINGIVNDYNGNTYTNGILLYIGGWSRVIEDDVDESDMIIGYPLNSQYKTLKGNIVLPKSYQITTFNNADNCYSSPTDVFFYGDGKLIYKATAVTASMPFKIDIDLNGVNQLTIKVKASDAWGQGSVPVALTDLALYK